MLLHSKELLRLYPEQIWLDDLQKSGQYADSDDLDLPDLPDGSRVHGPKFCKPQHTAYKLRQLQASSEEQSALGQLLTILKLRKAA
jgi:hypothetical protein